MTKDSLRSTLCRGRLGDAVRAFLCRKVVYGGTLHSDGNTLYSYVDRIAVWEDENIVMLNCNRHYTRTTNRHRNMLRDMATAQGIPIIEKQPTNSPYKIGTEKERLNGR